MILVSSGFQNDISCLSDTSPSSTAGSPAGGAYPTGGGGFVFSFSFSLPLFQIQFDFLVGLEKILAVQM